jgi:hypothetical protein
MIDALVPFVFGILLYFKPEIFIKKDSEDFEKKKAKMVMIGKALFGISALLFFGSILMSAK